MKKHWATLVAAILLTALTIPAHASFTTRLYLMVSSTLNESSVSLSADGSSYTFYTAAASGGASSIYAFHSGQSTPSLVSGSLQYCGLPRISNDGNNVVFWAEYFDGTNNVMKPYLVTWNSITNQWNDKYAIPVNNTTWVASATVRGCEAPAVTNTVTLNANTTGPIVVFVDPVGHAILPDTTIYKNLMRWDALNGVEYVYEVHRNCDKPWVNPDPTQDTRGLVVTYVGSSSTVNQIYRYCSGATPQDSCISLNSTSGALANGACDNPQSSANDEYVVYQTTASNLDGSNTGGTPQVYVCDTQSGSYGNTTRAYSTSLFVDATVVLPTISPDGATIAYQVTSASGGSSFESSLFASLATPQVSTPVTVVYMNARTNRTTVEAVSYATNGTLKVSMNPWLANGPIIGFDSTGSGIATGDTNSRNHAYKLSGHSW